MKCQLAGAGMLLFVWVIGFVVRFAFEKEIGLYGGNVIGAFMVAGVVLGYATMRECRAKRPPSS